MLREKRQGIWNHEGMYVFLKAIPPLERDAVNIFGRMASVSEV
jgi:hypothetical protein